MKIRKVPLVFLFIANLIILAHAVISHHHHEHTVCFVASHCSNDAEVHSHVTEATHHEHDGNSNAENCVLNQIVVTPPNNNRGYAGLFASDRDFNIHPDFMSCNEWSQISFSDFPFSIIIQVFPDYLFRIISRMTSGCGLRAPPLS